MEQSYYWRHREEQLARKLAYVALHRERYRENTKRWRKNNPEKCRQYKRDYRRRKAKLRAKVIRNRRYAPLKFHFGMDGLGLCGVRTSRDRTISIPSEITCCHCLKFFKTRKVLG